jgi:hexokinase
MDNAQINYNVYSIRFFLIEKGEYLALDLGGTNFRVLYTKLENGKMDNPIVKYVITII